jgi:hypothetical protein
VCAVARCAQDTHLHVPEHHEPAFCARVSQLITSRHAGEVLQVCHRGRELFAQRRIDGSHRLYPTLQRACERFGVSLPAAYDTHVCAFVLASRASLLRHPKALYEQLHAWHLESSASAPGLQGAASDAELAPWVLEHVWKLLLFPDTDATQHQQSTDESESGTG